MLFKAHCREFSDILETFNSSAEKMLSLKPGDKLDFRRDLSKVDFDGRQKILLSRRYALRL